MRKFLKILRYSIFFFAFFYCCHWFFGKMACEERDGYVKASFEGVVVKKFIDRTQHSYPYLYLRKYNERDTILKLIVDDDTNIYRLTQLNDTIIKLRNDPFLYKRVNSTNFKLGVLNMGCKE